MLCRIIVIAALLLSGNVFAATVPKLAGSYIFSFNKTCQATMTSSLRGEGDISAAMFQVKITPNKTGVAGSVTVSGYNNVGSNILFGTQSDKLTENIYSNKLLTYSNTATTIYMSGFNQTFHVYYGSIDSGNIAHYAAIISLSNDSNVYSSTIKNINKCTTQGTFTRQ